MHYSSLLCQDKKRGRKKKKDDEGEEEEGEDEGIDRSKARKFKEIWESLPNEVKIAYEKAGAPMLQPSEHVGR